jgi:hypothetical protein
MIWKWKLQFGEYAKVAVKRVGENLERGMRANMAQGKRILSYAGSQGR